jgi:hypothetical protein
MRKVTFFQVTRNSDSTEGRGHSVPTDIGFTHRADAVDFAKSRHYAKNYGVMGTPGSDFDVDEVTYFIYKSVEEWEDKAPGVEEERDRAAALSKLTDKERKLLGLEGN